jgi:hypothetical protein
MTHWRMQLHPGKPGEAMRHAVESLAAGFVGLDFETDPGDLTRASTAQLPEAGKDYGLFAREMAEGDEVLIIVHHFPFALTRVTGPYNYVRHVCPELGIWFRHFRRVDKTRFYADLVTNAQKWEQLTMTDTISPLRDPGSLSYRWIESWKGA